MHGPDLSKLLAELERASDEQEAPVSPGSTYAKPYAWLYFVAVVPFFGGVLVAVECRVVFGMYQLFALAGGVAFSRWAFLRRPSTADVATLAQAWEMARRWTALFGAVPLSACLVFLFVDRTFGVFWAYVVTGVASLMCFGLVEGNLAVPPPSQEVPERGRKQGGIDDKLRDEYEKARRQQAGHD